MSITLITAPTLAALTVPQTKLHLRVDGSDEDGLITAMIEAATQECEHITQSPLLPQDWRLTLDQWPVNGLVVLPKGNVTAIKSVKYADPVTGAMQTLAGTEWQADLTDSRCARLAPAYGKYWPTTRCQLAAVQIEFTAGWPDASSVPALVNAWLLMRVAALYQNREAWTLGKAIERNDFVDRLLDRYSLVTL